MKKISKNLSERFAVMSFLCACMIVFFHATPASDGGSLNWWFFHLFGREGVCCIAVPYFFTCSGFFLASHLDEKGWWNHEVAKRVKSLVVPFFIWMTIGLVFGLCIVYVKNRFFNANVTSEFLVVRRWEKILLYLGLHPFRDIGALWYVRTLFFMVILSPIIFFFLRWAVTMFFILFIAHLATAYLFSTGLSLEMYFLLDRFISIRGLLYFFAGAVIRINLGLQEFMPSTRIGMLGLGVGLTLLVGKNLLLLASLGDIGAIVEVFVVPCLIVGVWNIVPTGGWMKKLTGYSFPIFLVHNIFLSLVSMVFMVFGLRDNIGQQIPIAIVRSCCAIIGSIMITVSIKRIAPQASVFLWGGR